MEVTENSDEADKYNERERLKMRVAVLEESVRSYEVECKASRMTVLRLVAELEQERRKATCSATALDSLKVELDGMVLGRRNTDMEKHSLTERLEASRRVIEAASQETRCLEKQVEEAERKVHTSQGEAQAARQQHQTFLEKMAAFLQGDSDKAIPPTERDILHKLDTLRNMEESEKMVMDTRLSTVSGELSRQAELHESALQRAQLAEKQVQDLRERLAGLESDMRAADMHHEGLYHSKQHNEEFLEQLSERMKVDSIDVDLDGHMRLELILSRAEQLVKQEGAALVESKAQVYSLKRKLKLQKDRLESKELHAQLLRKKVSDMEEEKRRRSTQASERDDVHLQVRRLQKKLERFQKDLNTAKLSNAELKAQLCHANELKLKVMAQSQSLQEQSRKLGELEVGRAEVERTLGTVTSKLQSQERKARDKLQEITSLRQSLAQLSERERELVDFRLVVSNMLGLDVTALSHPNYEIIKSLESLLLPHLHHLHHYHTLPYICPAHQSSHVPQFQNLHDSSSIDLSTSGYASHDVSET